MLAISKPLLIKARNIKGAAPRVDACVGHNCACAKADIQAQAPLPVDLLMSTVKGILFTIRIEQSSFEYRVRATQLPAGAETSSLDRAARRS